MKLFLSTVLTIFLISSAKGQTLDVNQLTNTEQRFPILHRSIIPFRLQQSFSQNLSLSQVLRTYNSITYEHCFNKEVDKLKLNKHTSIGSYYSKKNKRNSNEINANVLGDTIPVDTLKTTKRKSVHKDLFSLHGRSISEIVLGNNTYTTQTLPTSYLRQQVNLSANVGFVPLDVSFLITTEKKGISNTINNIGISVDFDKLIGHILASSLKKQLGHTSYDKSVYSDMDTTFDLQAFNINKAIKKYHYTLDSLKKITNNIDYVQQINQDSLNLKKADTLNLTYGEKISQNRYQKHQQMIAIKDSLEDKISELEIEKRRNKISNFLGSQQRISKKNLNAAGVNTLGGLLLNSVRKVNIGNFTPEYTDLTLSQTNLTGLGIELGVGYLYLAFAAGKQRNIANQQSFFRLNNNIIAGRVGVGRPDKLLLSLNLLKGQRDGSLLSDTIRFAINQNLVTSLSLQYSYKQKITTVFEYAKSVSKYNESEKAQLSALNRSANYGADAFSFKLMGSYKNNGFYQAEIRYTEPFYTSLGAPNLRRDNLRSDFKIRHQILKNKITGNLGFFHDRDNISNTKNTTSTQIRMTAGLRIKFKKLPLLFISYSPIRQKLNTLGNVTLYKAAINLLMVSLNHAKRLKIGSNNTTVTYNLYTSKVSSETVNKSRRDNILINNTVYYRKYNLTFTQSIAGYTTFHSDSSMGASAGLAASKDLTEKKTILGLGWRYQWDKNIETRNILFLELAIKFKYQIQASLKVEQSFIQSSWNDNNPHTQQLFLTLIKHF